jgi:hypothetical protein
MQEQCRPHGPAHLDRLIESRVNRRLVGHVGRHEGCAGFGRDAPARLFGQVERDDARPELREGAHEAFAHAARPACDDHPHAI